MKVKREEAGGRGERPFKPVDCVHWAHCALLMLPNPIGPSLGASPSNLYVSTSASFSGPE